MKRDEHDLESVAGAIADGDPINWPELAPEGDAQKPNSVLDALRVLDAIAQVHRSQEPSQTSTETFQSQDDTRTGEPRLEQWGPFTILAEIGRGSFGAVYRA